MSERFQVVPPVKDGYAWWNVIDTQSHTYWGEDNFAVATISIHAPNAEANARNLALLFNTK